MEPGGLTKGVVRVHTLEQQIGAGLIEEIVEVAEGELQLIETMEKSKP